MSTCPRMFPIPYKFLPSKLICTRLRESGNADEYDVRCTCLVFLRARASNRSRIRTISERFLNGLRP